jgi:hypothetical protein
VQPQPNNKKTCGARAARKVKESALLRLDLVCAHEEMRPLRGPHDRSFGVPHSDSTSDFVDWFALDCPDDAERMRAVAQKTIADTLEAWRNGRGQKARKSKRAPKKMDAVVLLLAQIGITCTAAALAVLWSRLRADGRATWREDEWFQQWGAKSAASARN